MPRTRRRPPTARQLPPPQSRRRRRPPPAGGAVRDAAGRRVLFVPQRSYFPAFCTLRGALAYPEPPETFSDEAFLEALRGVQMESVLAGDLATEEVEDDAIE